MKKENVSILKAAVGIELIDSTHSDEHEHGGEETHSDELEHESEETHSDDHEGEEGATEDHVHEDDGHDHGDLDPRVWLDPVLAIDLANNIKNSLSDIMPEHASEFESNFLQLKSDLEKLIQDFKSTVDNSKTKYLLVSHAAYGYWESRYGIEEIAISSLSPSQVPSQKELQEIVQESTEHGVHYVIFEQNLTPKVAEMIQKEIGTKSLTLHNLEAITEENIKQGDDYFSIMRKNLETIQSIK